MKTPMTGIRASDAEREQISKLLQTAAGEGRLTPDEAGERLAEAQGATYRHELEQLVADLPPVVVSDVSRGRGGSVPRAFWVAGALLRATAFVGFLLLFWRFAFWPMALLGMFAFFAFARTMRYGWYARRAWWMTRRGSPDRWVTVVR
jgi:Flp pilus assembly protein TadB